GPRAERESESGVGGAPRDAYPVRPSWGWGPARSAKRSWGREPGVCRLGPAAKGKQAGVGLRAQRRRCAGGVGGAPRDDASCQKPSWGWGPRAEREAELGEGTPQQRGSKRGWGPARSARAAPARRGRSWGSSARRISCQTKLGLGPRAEREAELGEGTPQQRGSKRGWGPARSGRSWGSSARRISCQTKL